MYYHTDTAFLCLTAYSGEFDFSKAPDGNLAAFANSFVRLFTGQSVDGSLSGGDILGGQASANAKSGTDDTIQPKRGQGVPNFLGFRLRHSHGV